MAQREAASSLTPGMERQAPERAVYIDWLRPEDKLYLDPQGRMHRRDDIDDQVDRPTWLAQYPLYRHHCVVEIMEDQDLRLRDQDVVH